jgi:predicted RNA methylase
MRHGWFVIPGVQTGDRTADEQCAALKVAIDHCKGKTVLDLGCAEGLIGKAFAKAGARCVLGVDNLADHIKVAREQCNGLPMEFTVASLEAFINTPLPDPFAVGKYDIVLALGVSHKLQSPRNGIELAARYSKDLVLFRRGLRQTDGVIRSKHFANSVDQHELMRELGFEMDHLAEGVPPHNEAVEYWRRLMPA